LEDTKKLLIDYHLAANQYRSAIENMRGVMSSAQLQKLEELEKSYMDLKVKFEKMVKNYSIE
jgi:hypothetical protein